MNVSISPLGKPHSKKDFSCGIEALDNYLHFQAGQDLRRKLAVCFVLVNTDRLILGYYTLSSAGIPRKLAPLPIQSKLPKAYNTLPVTLLGRLAVDLSQQGKKYGELLLLDALKRCLEIAKSQIGAIAVIVDPINEAAEKFYETYGFIKLEGSGKMFISMKTIIQLFQ